MYILCHPEPWSCNSPIVSLKLFLWGPLCSTQLFLHAVGSVYLFSVTYLTDLSSPWCIENSEAQSVSVIDFAVKGPLVSRNLTLMSKTTVMVLSFEIA